MQKNQLKLDLFSDIASAAGPALAAGPQAAIGAVTTFGGSLINAQTQRQLNERQEANAWDMYQTSRRDADSAHQREVEDLKKAGLNPILSVMGKGNATTTGSVAPATAPQLQIPDMLAMLQQLAQIKKTNAEADILQPKKSVMDDLNKGYRGFTGIIEDIGLKLGEAYQDRFGSEANKEKYLNQQWKEIKEGYNSINDNYIKKPVETGIDAARKWFTPRKKK